MASLLATFGRRSLHIIEIYISLNGTGHRFIFYISYYLWFSRFYYERVSVVVFLEWSEHLLKIFIWETKMIQYFFHLVSRIWCSDFVLKIYSYYGIKVILQSWGKINIMKYEVILDQDHPNKSDVADQDQIQDLDLENPYWSSKSRTCPSLQIGTNSVA